MNLTNKQVVTVVAPAAITLITGLGALYKFDTTAITGTIALLTTFAGTALASLAISIKTHKTNKENKYEYRRTY